MKRKSFYIGQIALILTICMIFCGCENKNPLPKQDTIEGSDNSFGARYTFTLETFTAMAAKAFDAEDFLLKKDGWKPITDDLVDDNGVKYSSYYQRAGEITFTVAVEADNGKVMNIGCGCETKRLGDEDFRDSFVRICARTAIAAGGYEDRQLDFFVGIFNDLLDGDDEIVSHGESLYIISVDDAATVLMTAPCSEDIIEKNHYPVINQ